MGVNKRQQTSTELAESRARTAVLDAALRLDTEADLFRELPINGTEDGATVGVVSPVQWQCIWLLVAGKRQIDVACELGVSQETISRWKNNPAFGAALNWALRENHESNIGEIRDLARGATAVLRETLHSEDERLRASVALSIVKMSLQIDASAQSLPSTPAEVARLEKRRRSDAAMSSMLTLDFG